MRTVARAALAVGLFAVASLVGPVGCGGDNNDVSATSLKPRLLPAAFVPGSHLLKTFDWSDPVNLVGEGLFLPEATHPSQAVNELDDVGLRGSAGEILNQGGANGDELRTGVIKLESDSAAGKLRDWMHSQDLQQPCLASCIFSPQNLPIPGVPDGKAVKQAPMGAAKGPPGLPPGAKVPAGLGPPTRYLVEFTVGPYLYFAHTEGDSKTAPRFVAITKRYYEQVKDL
jgi:hypothetical protein